MEKSRIAALVDGIFAVAMTLLVLDLKPPEGVKLSSDAEVSIAVSFFNPSLALSAYWLLLAFHFLPGRHHRPPAVND